MEGGASATHIVIRPGRRWRAGEAAEIWSHRDLLYLLVVRDLKVRYRQTLLGAAWVVLPSLLLTLVFTVFLAQLANVPSEDAPYAVFVFAGLLPWTFFSSAVGSCVNALAGSAQLITHVYFPRVLIPLAAICARALDFAVGLAAFLVVAAAYDVAITPRLLLLPLFAALVMALALAVGMWASALNVKYRDVGVALPVVLQIGMFLSPVVYPASLVPERWEGLYALNPMVGIVEGFRWSLIGGDAPWAQAGAAFAVVAVLLGLAWVAFRRLEVTFADVV